jgi:hypothetical protein
MLVAKRVCAPLPLKSTVPELWPNVENACKRFPPINSVPLVEVNVPPNMETSPAVKIFAGLADGSPAKIPPV